ncbi:MAG: tetratricopeptide repeat protein, partial [Gemmatimonadota bacterium]
ALQIDPEYATPWAGISRGWVARQQMGLSPPNEAFREAKEAVAKGLALDENDYAARRALASILTWGDWDWPAAERAWSELVGLNPDDPDLLNSYSHFLMLMGRPEEAMEAIDRALHLDPFNLKIRSFYVVDLLFVQRYDEAIAEAREVMRLQPNQPVAMSSLNQALYLTGRYEEALAVDREMFANRPEFTAALEAGYEESGYAGAQRRLADLWAQRYGEPGAIDAFNISLRYLYAGDHDLAVQWLETAYPYGGGALPYIVAPLHEPLRSDPRFQTLLRKMNLIE